MPAPSTAEAERPTALILEGKGTKTVRSLEASPKPPHTNCGLMKSKDMGIHQVAVGELHLGDAWGGFFALQPVSWPNGGMREPVGGDAPRCGNNKKFFGTVVPYGTLSRRTGSSITLDGAISLQG